MTQPGNNRRAVHAYTPGLRVTDSATICKVRRLPLPGEVHVEVGDEVTAGDIVASTELPGRVQTVNIAHELNCQPDEIERYVIKDVGEAVEPNEIIAESRALWGLFHSFVRAPVQATIESISATTGQVLLRGKPRPVKMDAYVDGTVVEIHENEGVTIEAHCSLVQGIFGIGGERHGELVLGVVGPDEPLTAQKVEQHAAPGCVLVGGSSLQQDALDLAREREVAAVVTGAMDSDIIDTILHGDLGVGITGQEDIPVTVIITEGFGELSMSEHAFEILESLAGHMASVSGITQIRAGVIRPEVIVSGRGVAHVDSGAEAELQMGVGSMIRLTRAPLFGEIAEVVELPAEPQRIETEAEVRVLIARLQDGRKVTVPRANVELIQQ
ncbi:MAG: hypothetical protein ACLFWB_08495 [Armatimonadota bacterium]